MESNLEIVLEEKKFPPDNPSKSDNEPLKPITPKKPIKPPYNMDPSGRLSKASFNSSELEKQIEEAKRRNLFFKPLCHTDYYFSKLVKEYIIGQDAAIDKLCYIVYHNLHENMMADYYGIDSPRYSAVVVGPSGCGKTATLTRIAQLFDIPFCKYNATPITSSGYVGKNVEDMLMMLLDAAGGDLWRAERGILYIDEIDKKVSTQANNTSGRDVNGTSVQEELLKFLESTEVDLGKGKVFDTHYLTVLMSGRFIDIDKIRKKRLRGETSMGFTTDSSDHKVYVPVDADDDDYNEFDSSDSPFYTHQDIIDFGFLDEFVGRIFDIIEFRQLTREDLVGVILAKDSVLRRFVAEVETKNQELIIDGAIYERMADAAYNSPRGARCLESIMNNFLVPAKRDFMHNIRPGIMEYDADGNYTSMFESPNPSVIYYKHIDGPRARRRAQLQASL